MEIINRIFKYIGYLSVSVILGWLSTFGGQDKDYLAKVASTIIPVLLALTALTTTLTGLLLNELYKFKSQYKIEINNTVDQLKRNVQIQIGLIAITFSFLCCKEMFIYNFPDIIEYILVVQNAIVVFSFLYFVLVIYDVATGLYQLIKKNNE